MYADPWMGTTSKSKGLMRNVMNHHPWLAPFTASRGDFDGPRRVAVLACLLATLMLINTILFRSFFDDKTTMVTKLLFLVCAIVATFFGVLLVDAAAGYLLRRSARAAPDDLQATVCALFSSSCDLPISSKPRSAYLS